ncbi:OmpA family protein [Chitinophaga vietnamensis]|uniref:OmpA family protein n=1 Tax=Chitinophaga vietnamensis TaxID=2593957 RepID=UPI001375DB94|nr:OmpA family protein [Chitinophaga vietnamensis]
MLKYAFINRLVLLMAGIAMASVLQAQEQPGLLEMAEKAYARQEYAVAAKLYEKIVNKKGRRMPVAQLLRLATCYRETGAFDNAAECYKVVVAMPGSPASATYAYAEVLRNLERYDEAKAQFHLFNATSADSLQRRETGLQGCDSAQAWQAASDLELKALAGLNTGNSEFISGVAAKALLLVGNGYDHMQLAGAVSRRADEDKRMEQPYYKAYIYRQYTTGDSKNYLEELYPELLGKYAYHVGPVCLSKHEDTLYFTVNEQGHNGSRKPGVVNKRKLVIYQSVKQGNSWGPPVLLPGINIDSFSASHPLLAEGGSVLYFVSDRPGGYGETDIWYCEKQSDNSWGPPLNCGANLNTIGAEAFPTLNEEGVLYFSSTGYPGLGGYDIFRARGNRSTWEKPVNMRRPFNSGGDDMGLILKDNGYEGYLSSNRKGGMGADDIYTFMDAHYFSRVNPPATNTGKDSVAGNDNDGKTGTDQHPQGGNSVATRVVPDRAKLTPEEEKDKQVLDNLKIYYDYNSAEIHTEYRVMLEELIAVMKRHADWKLLVISYSDSRGSVAYNSDLSSLRCYAVINYLASKGIDPKRLYYRNKGKQDIVNGCVDGVPCTDAQHKLNRRSTFKLIF